MKEQLRLAPILEFKNVFKTYQSGWFQKSQNYVLQDISFDVGRKETVAIVGESGCGKTTLAKCLMKIEDYQKGNILLHGQEIKDIPRKELARQIQMVFQDPNSSLNPRHRIFDLIAEPLVIFGMADAIQAKVEKAMTDVGLPLDNQEKYPHMLSGGQKQRVALARALVFRPEIMVCDEPVSALDVSVQAQVLNLLKDLQQKYDLSLIFVSHDLSVVKFIAHRVAVFFQGKLVELGTTQQIYENPQHEYTKYLLSCTPRLQVSANWNQG